MLSCLLADRHGALELMNQHYLIGVGFLVISLKHICFIEAAPIASSNHLKSHLHQPSALFLDLL
jgi:hypothetical protein